MKLVSNAREAWKWHSVQLMGLIAALPAVWVSLPDDVKSVVPDAWMPYVVSAVAVGLWGGCVIRVAKWLLGGSGFLNKALNSVDTYITSTTDKERIKADVVKSYYSNRTSWMQAGGFWLMFMFAAPVAIWHAAVVMDSLPYVRDLFGDQQVHALPPPLDEWAGWIVLACIGGAGAFAWRR